MVDMLTAEDDNGGGMKKFVDEGVEFRVRELASAVRNLGRCERSLDYSAVRLALRRSELTNAPSDVQVNAEKVE